MHRVSGVVFAVCARCVVVVGVDVVASVFSIVVAGGDVRRLMRRASPPASGLGPHARGGRPNATGVLAGLLDEQAARRFAARVYARVGARSEGFALLLRVLERVGARAGNTWSVDEAIRLRRVACAGLVRVAEARGDVIALRLAFGLGKALLQLLIDLVAAPAVATARADAGW